MHGEDQKANRLSDLQLEYTVLRIKKINKKHGFELAQMDRLMAFLLQGNKPESERGKECSPLARDPLYMI